MASSSTTKERERLTNVFAQLFILGFHLKNARDLGTPETLRVRLEHMYQEADRRGTEFGFSRDTLTEARYALAAFLDEMILSSRWMQKDEWASHSLQYQYFGIHVAGEEFFKRLDSLRRALPPNPELLEVYYLCLILGFEGQYKIQGREKLKDLSHDLYREIQGRRGDLPMLSPHGQRPEELIELVKRDVPIWVVAVSSLAIISFSYMALSILMSQESTEIAAEVQRMALEEAP